MNRILELALVTLLSVVSLTALAETPAVGDFVQYDATYTLNGGVPSKDTAEFEITGYDKTSDSFKLRIKFAGQREEKWHPRSDFRSQENALNLVSKCKENNGNPQFIATAVGNMNVCTLELPAHNGFASMGDVPVYGLVYQKYYQGSSQIELSLKSFVRGEPTKVAAKSLALGEFAGSYSFVSGPTVEMGPEKCSSKIAISVKNNTLFADSIYVPNQGIRIGSFIVPENDNSSEVNTLEGGTLTYNSTWPANCSGYSTSGNCAFFQRHQTQLVLTNNGDLTEIVTGVMSNVTQMPITCVYKKITN